MGVQGARPIYKVVLKPLASKMFKVLAQPTSVSAGSWAQPWYFTAGWSKTPTSALWDALTVRERSLQLPMTLAWGSTHVLTFGFGLAATSF